MSSEQIPREVEGPLTVEVSNIGGIESQEATIPPGVTVLQGENATNRTSFLQALMAALGSDRATLKGDADKGHASITIDDETYTRTLTRTGDTVSFTGDPFLEDSTKADLYSFLLTDNEVRRTIQQNGDLYDVLMRPIDTDEIEANITDLQQEQSRIEDKLEAAKEAADKLPALEEEKNRLETQREDLKEKIETLNGEIETLEEQAEEASSQEKVSELTEELNQKQQERNRVTNQIQTAEAKYENAQSELAALDIPDRDRDSLKADLEDLEEKRDAIEQEIESVKELEQQLTNAIDTNRNILDSEWNIGAVMNEVPGDISLPDGPLSEDAIDAASPDHVTDDLVEGEHVLCQSCGSSVTADRIRAITNQYQALRDGLKDEINRLNEKSRELATEIEDIEATLAEFNQAQTRRADLESTIDEYGPKLETLRDRKAALEDEIEALHDDLEAIETDSNNKELVDKRTERNNAQNELSQVENELADIKASIDEYEQKANQRDDLNERLDEIRANLEELHGTVEAREKELVDQFNTQMETIVERLDYENIGRIWIDRKVETNRRGESQTEFDLIISREGESGVYEDRLEHLSESERTITGLVVALTGYLVHDVHEICPVMLLDSVEMIDSNRIAALLDYFEDYADYLVAALLPEDAATLDDTNDTVTVIDW
jgi:predicted  nucleic acid-binding Zn-ribbon protein